LLTIGRGPTEGKDVQSITTQAAQEPAPGLFSTPLFVRIHLALTVLLMASLMAVGVLIASGLLHFGKQAEAGGESDKAAADAEKPKSKEAEGRFQIEPADDVRRVLVEGSKFGGALDSRVWEAWAFRYKGGLLESTLEADVGGHPLYSGALPNAQEWSRFLHEQGVQPDNLEALNREGHLILAGMITPVSVEQQLRPLYLHLGAAFTKGPAGPLHTLLPYCLDVETQLDFRHFLTVDPTEKKQGVTLWSNPWLPIRSHLVPAPEPPARLRSSKNLEAGKPFTVLERPLGKSVIRLKVRFLTEQEAVEKAKAKAE
jgi:hypothetical protein